MAAGRVLSCSRSKCFSPAIIFRTHDCMVTSVLLIQTRTKFSKTSPFGKRPNPQKKQLEEQKKSQHGAYLARMSAARPLDRPIIIDSPGAIFSDYLPIRRYYFFTPWGIKERWNAFKNGLWTVYRCLHNKQNITCPLVDKNFIFSCSTRYRVEHSKIKFISTCSLAVTRRYVKPFKIREFAEQAQNIYIDVNKALISKSKKDLQEVVTNKVYTALSNDFFPPQKNLHWRFVSAVTRPRVLHVRVASVEKKQNLFVQVTVKIHSKQVMAIKDKHGRHITGSDKEIKEVVDYVVFERHLTNNYGVWKVCGKLHPLPQKTNAGKQLARTVPSV